MIYHIVTNNKFIIAVIIEIANQGCMPGTFQVELLKKV